MKKYLVSSLGLVAVLGLGAVVALAENSTTPPTGTSTTITTTNIAPPTAPMILNIGPSGNVMMRGQVVSVGTNSLVLKSWGGSWTINVSATTKILSTNKALSDFAVDSFVGVMGTMTKDGTFAVDATILRQWGRMRDENKDGVPDGQESSSELKHMWGEGRGGPGMMGIKGGEGQGNFGGPGTLGGNRGPGGEDNQSGGSNTSGSTSTSGGSN